MNILLLSAGSYKCLGKVYGSVCLGINMKCPNTLERDSICAYYAIILYHIILCERHRLPVFTILATCQIYLVY